MEARPEGREQLWALAMLLSLLVVTAAWWALALWPVSSTAPAWLARTQVVCFGTQDNGMPDLTGWTGLIACPFGMLLLLVSTAGRPLASLAARARSERWLQVLALIIFFAGTSASAAAASRIAGAYREDVEEIVTNEFGSSVRLDRTAPPLSLLDQSGVRRDLGDVAGRPVVVTFAYAHCETVCPLLVHNAIAAQNSLRGTKHDVALLVITLDPARDTPARLPAIAAQWGLRPDAYILSGTTSEVQKTLDDWGVARSYNTTNGDVTHPSIAYIIGRNGRLIYEVSAPTSEQLIHLVKAL